MVRFARVPAAAAFVANELGRKSEHQQIGERGDKNKRGSSNYPPSPMFSASPVRDWNAIPTHSPLELKTGPPLFPELIAASIWMPSSSVEPCA